MSHFIEGLESTDLEFEEIRTKLETMISMVQIPAMQSKMLRDMKRLTVSEGEGMEIGHAINFFFREVLFKAQPWMASPPPLLLPAHLYVSSLIFPHFNHFI